MPEPAPYYVGDEVTVNGHTGVVVNIEPVDPSRRDFGLRWRLTVDLTTIEVVDTVLVNNDGRNTRAGERVTAAPAHD